MNHKTCTVRSDITNDVIESMIGCASEKGSLRPAAAGSTIKERV